MNTGTTASWKSTSYRMKQKIRRFISSVALKLIACTAATLAAPAAHAQVIQDGVNIQVTWVHPDTSGVYGTPFTVTKGPGVEVTCPDSNSFCSGLFGLDDAYIDFTDSTIDMLVPSSAFEDTAFNGFKFDFPAGMNITNVVSVGPTTVEPSRISFTSTAVMVNFQGIAPGHVTLRLSTKSVTSAVKPVPTLNQWTLFLLATLLGVLGLNSRREKPKT